MSQIYMNNPKLKGDGITLGFTKLQIEELIKCKEDPIYFINNYVKIIDVDKGIVPFKLRQYQEDWVNLLKNERFTIAKWSRQLGKSTSSIGYILWLINFQSNQRVALCANKGSTARTELLGRLQSSFENIPLWMQVGIISWNKGSLELENGSRVIAAATSSSAVRGGSYNLLYLDEFAFIPDNVAEEFFRSVYPTISSGKTTKVVITSTPHGCNHFFKMWNDAEKGVSTFKPMEVNWDADPRRDVEWYETELANLGEEAFQQEHMGSFIGSSSTLISAQKLKILMSSYKDPIWKQDGLDVYIEPTKTQFTTTEGEVYFIPNKYVICADTAKGKFLDYSAFVVIDITEIPYKIVAKYRNNSIAPMLFGDLIYNIAKKYHDAYIMVESNNGGDRIAESISMDLDYENVLKVTPNGRGGQHLSSGYAKSSQFGLNMSSPVKKIGCTNLKSLLEKDKIQLCDFDIVQEFTTFVRTGDKFAADEGKHDDLVMCLVQFAWMVQDKYFRQLVDSDLRERMRQDYEKELADNNMPCFIINDGTIRDFTKFNNSDLLWFPIDR